MAVVTWAAESEPVPPISRSIRNWQSSRELCADTDTVLNVVDVTDTSGLTLDEQWIVERVSSRGWSPDSHRSLDVPGLVQAQIRMPCIITAFNGRDSEATFHAWDDTFRGNEVLRAVFGSARAHCEYTKELFSRVGPWSTYPALEIQSATADVELTVWYHPFAATALLGIAVDVRTATPTLCGFVWWCGTYHLFTLDVEGCCQGDVYEAARIQLQKMWDAYNHTNGIVDGKAYVHVGYTQAEFESFKHQLIPLL